jgi:hypothetical protein
MDMKVLLIDDYGDGFTIAGERVFGEGNFILIKEPNLSKILTTIREEKNRFGSSRFDV